MLEAMSIHALSESVMIQPSPSDPIQITVGTYNGSLKMSQDVSHPMSTLIKTINTVDHFP